MPLAPAVFNDVRDLTVAFCLFACDNDAVSTTSSCPFSSISLALRFLAGVTDIFAPLCRWYLCNDKIKEKKIACALINGERIDTLFTQFLHLNLRLNEMYAECFPPLNFTERKIAHFPHNKECMWYTAVTTYLIKFNIEYVLLFDQ